MFRFIYTYFSALIFRKHNSIIIIQKVCTNRLYANALKLLVLLQNRNTLYDIDDAEYIRTKTTSLHFFLKKCESVSVGSRALFDYCLPFNQQVYLQTSPVIKHQNRKLKKEKKLTFGWVGDAGNGDLLSHPFSHKASLFKYFFSALRAIDHPVKIVLIGITNEKDVREIHSYFSNSPHVEIEIPSQLDWENDDWLYKDITKFDIGVSPMTNHPFNQAKSAFKAKQYLSCGVPVIASDVGETRKFVINNYNGVICENQEDFKNAILKFVQMKDSEYKQFSMNCTNNLDRYSIDNYCRKLIHKQKRAAK